MDSNLYIKAFVVSWLCLAALGCESDEIRGQLVISIESDMALPKDIDEMLVQISVHGAETWKHKFQLKDVKLPATLTLLASNDPALSVTVRVAGSKESHFRTFREAIVTVPYGRLSHLRMPLQWLCDGKARQGGADPFGQEVRSTCDDGHTCVAGECVDTPSTKMPPDFAARDVYGRADRPEDGKCFDTWPCMITGSVVTLTKDCTFELPQREYVNVALRVPNTGICDESRAACFVPLDGESQEGWNVTDDNRHAQLPQTVCDKLASGEISGVYLSTKCPTKTAADPPCGAWSSVTTKGQSPPASALSHAPKVEIAKLQLDAEEKLCCPLLLDATGLYTCTCASGRDASVVRIDPQSGSTDEVFRVSPPDDRSFAATIADGAFFWVAQRTVEQIKLDDPDMRTSFQLSGDVYDDSPLLSDDSSLLALGNRPEGASGSAVQVLRVSYADKLQALDPLDTGGNLRVAPFDRGPEGVYVAVDVDDGQERASSVVRIDRRSGERTPLVAAEQFDKPKDDRGGYLGVKLGSNTLYALFERVADNIMELRAIDPSGSSAPTVFHQRTLVPHRRINLLGVVGDTPILARTEYVSIIESSGDPRSTSIYAVTAAGETPRILADLTEDAPHHLGLVSDDQHIYVLTSHGALLRIARAGLP